MGDYTCSAKCKNGGAEYTAGDGIVIEDNTISVVGKQDTLTAGVGIDISVENVISEKGYTKLDFATEEITNKTKLVNWIKNNVIDKDILVYWKGSIFSSGVKLSSIGATTPPSIFVFHKLYSGMSQESDMACIYFYSSTPYMTFRSVSLIHTGNISCDSVYNANGELITSSNVDTYIDASGNILKPLFFCHTSSGNADEGGIINLNGVITSNRAWSTGNGGYRSAKVNGTSLKTAIVNGNLTNIAITACTGLSIYEEEIAYNNVEVYYK